MPNRPTLCLAALALAALPPGAPGAAKKDRAGDPLPEGALARLGTVRLRAGYTITATAFSPDGKAAVSGGLSDKLTFWEVATGKASRSVRLAGTSQVTALHFSADGKVLAAACFGTESGVRILDGRTGEEVKFLRDSARGGFARHGLALSADGKAALAHDAGGRTLLVWDVEDASIKHRFSGITNPWMAFTPDGKQFVTTWTDGKLHLVNVADGKSARDLEADRALSGQGRLSGQVVGLAVTPDGKEVFSRRLYDTAFQVIDLETGKLARTWHTEALGHQGYGAGALALTPNGRFLLEASGAVRLWGVASAKQLREFGPTPYPATFAISKDGKTLALASGGVLNLWGLATGKPLHGSAGHRSEPLRLAFSRDGKRLVSVGTSTMRVWEADSGKELRQSRQYGHGVAHLTAEGGAARWVSIDRSVYRWRYDRDREPARLTSPRTLVVDFGETALSPDGRTLAAAGGPSRKFRLIDQMEDRPDRELMNLAQEYGNQITFSPDSRLVALSSFSDKVVTLFDVGTGLELRKLQALGANTFPASPVVAFAPDGRSLLKHDGETRLIETATGGERLRLPRERGHVPKLAWSGDGRLAVRAHDSGLVTVHDTLNRKELWRKQTGQGSITAVALSRDGRRLATGGADTTVLVWELPAAGEVQTKLEEKEAWRELENADAEKGFAAVAYFVANPGEAVKRFKERVRPRSAPGAKVLAQLIKDLDDDAFAVREKASEDLADIGAPALDAIQEALKDPPSLEVKRRCEALLRKIRGGGGVAPDRLRAARAVEALERIGTPEAREVLKHLLTLKVAPDLEAAIQGALRRLSEE